MMEVQMLMFRLDLDFWIARNGKDGRMDVWMEGCIRE
jgi:hypothetical protein